MPVLQAGTSIHMLTSFDLVSGVTIEELGQSVKLYKQHMLEKALCLAMGPIAERQNDTIMDTDNERNHQYFLIGTFEDRAHCDKAVDYILKHEEPDATIHNVVYSKVQNQIFICWQEIQLVHPPVAESHA